MDNAGLSAWAFALGVSAYLLVAVSWVGARREHYSSLKNTISELGEYGSPWQWKVSLGIFLPVGILMGILAFFLQPEFIPQSALAGSLAVGYGVAALFPCDPDSPLYGSVRQAVHNLGGAVEYLGGALSFFWIAETQGEFFRILGFMVGGSLILLSYPNPLRGLLQRLAEICLFGGLVVSLILLGPN